MKTKILILLFSCVFISVAILLAISILTFKSDKMAYIFETVGRETELVTRQLSFEIKSADDLSMQFLQFYSTKNEVHPEEFSKISDKMSAQMKNALEYFCIFQINSENEIKCVFESKADSQPVAISVEKKIHEIIRHQNAVAQKTFFTVGDVFYQIVLGQVEPQKQGLVYAFKSVAYAEYKKKNANEGNLSNRDEYFSIVDRTFSSLDAGLNDKTNPLFGRLAKEINIDLNNQVSQMTGVVNLDQKWVYSIYPVAQTNLNVVSLVTEKKAMSVMQTVYRRVGLTFVIIIGCILIVGVLAALTLTNQLNKLTEITRRLTKGDFDAKINVKGKDEVAQLSQDFNSMTVELKRLMSETAEKARMENELKTAQLVQESLFPKNEHNYSMCKLSGYYKPASECGGDWWFHTETEKFIYLIIADATGHGVPAALMTSAIKSAFTLVYESDVELNLIMSKLNKALCEVGHAKVMMTSFLFRIDKITLQAEYVNASHEAPIVIDLNQDTIDKSSLNFLNETNSPRLGENPDTVYKVTQVQLLKNQRLFFYTDGIYDLKNIEDKKLTERAFLKKLVSLSQEKSEFKIYCSDVKNFLINYHQKETLDDDVTFCNLETNA